MKLNNLIVISLGILAFSLWLGQSLSILLIPIEIFLICYLIVFKQIKKQRSTVISNHSTLHLITKTLLFGLLSIILSGLISSINAMNLSNVILFLGRYSLSMILLILILTSVRKKQEVNIIINSILCGGIFTSLLLLFNLYVYKISALNLFDPYSRAQGFLNHPNQLGIIFSSIIPLAVGNYIANIKNSGNLLITLLLFVGLFLSGSKMNIIIASTFGLLLLFVVVFLNNSAQKRITYSLTILSLLPFAAIVFKSILVDLMPRTYYTLIEIFNNPAEARTIEVRLSLWKQAIEVGNSSFIGVGADNAGYYLPFSHAHNIFFDFYATTGVLGFISLCVFLIGTLLLIIYAYKLLMNSKVLKKDKIKIISITFSIISYFISNQSSDSFGATTLPFLSIYIALLIVLTSNIENSIKPISKRKFKGKQNIKVVGNYQKYIN